MRVRDEAGERAIIGFLSIIFPSGIIWFLNSLYSYNGIFRIRMLSFFGFLFFHSFLVSYKTVTSHFTCQSIPFSQAQMKNRGGTGLILKYPVYFPRPHFHQLHIAFSNPSSQTSFF